MAGRYGRGGVLGRICSDSVAFLEIPVVPSCGQLVVRRRGPPLAVLSQDRPGARHVLGCKTGSADLGRGIANCRVRNCFSMDWTLGGWLVEQTAPMKRVLLPIVVLLFVAPLAFAHVGSPNVSGATNNRT